MREDPRMPRTAWRLLGLALTAVFVTAAVLVARSLEARETPRDRFAKAFDLPASEIFPWSHYTLSSARLELAWTHDHRGNVVLLQRGPTSAGGITFASGW